MSTRRLAIVVALGIALSPIMVPVLVRSKEPAAEKKVFAGKVVSVSEAAAKRGIEMDKDAAPYWLALETKDGKLYPLWKDSGTRMFFKDKDLRNRPVQVTGRMIQGSEILQVFSVRTVRDGKRFEPYYWCDICAIKRFEPNACDCCGAPLEFREEPVAK